MAIPLLGVAIRIAVKMGLRFAEQKKWLPNQAYTQLAMDRLKENNLSEASRLNGIALQKNPQSEKAQILSDVISMRIDAGISTLVQELEQLNQQLVSAQNNIILYRKEQKSIRQQQKFRRALIVLPIILLCILAGLYIFFPETMPKLILAILAILLLSLLITAFIQERKNQMEKSLTLKELDAAIQSTQKEIAILNNKVDELNKKINQERLRHAEKTKHQI